MSFLYPLDFFFHILPMQLFEQHVQRQEVCPRNVNVHCNIIPKACRDTEKKALLWVNWVGQQNGPKVDNLLKPRHQSAIIEFASPNCTQPYLLALTFLHGWDGMQGNVFDSEVYAILIQWLILFTCNALLYFLIHVLWWKNKIKETVQVFMVKFMIYD